MNPAGLFHLARRDLAADRRGAFVNAVATCIGAAALAFFVALGLGVGEAARRIFPSEAGVIEVVPASVSLGGLLGGGQLDDEAVARLAAVPGVVHAYPKLNLRVPLAASRPPDHFPLNWPPGLTLMVPAVGVPPGLIASELAPGARFDDAGAGGPIPVVASKRLFEIYNRTIAPSWNLRRLPPGPSLIGAQLPVRIGFSILPQKIEDHVTDGRLELAGLSERVPVYLLAMPLETVRRLHREYGKADAGYTSVTLVAARPDDVPTVAAAVRRTGFSVDEGERALAERVGTVIAVTTGVLALVALLMCALASLAIAQSLSASVRARSREIAILQAVGATPGDAAALILVEAALIGAAGGVAGAVLARLAAAGADRAFAALVSEFPFRPTTLFAFSPWLYALAFAVAVLSAVLGALAPARAAARVDPARAIS